MDLNIWVVAASTIVVSMVFSHFTSKGYSRIDYQKKYIHRYKFKPSIWALGLALLCSSLTFLLFSLPFTYQSKDKLDLLWECLIFGGVGSIWFIIFFGGFLRIKSSYLIIEGDMVELKFGRKIKRIKLSHLHRAEQIGLEIWILSNNRKVILKIPVVFKGCHDILSILQQRISEANSSG